MTIQQQYQQTKVLTGPQNESGSLIMKSFESHQIRIITDEHGDPWFVAKDVCEALGYTNSRKALSDHVDEEDVTKRDTLTKGGIQAISYINESGLYSLILSSKLDSAKRMKRWVTSEVLPSIRKTGSYGVASTEQQLPGNYIQALEHLLQSERDKEQIKIQRDEAIRTKACISSSREASVMAKLGHTKREVESLKEKLGVGTKHKSVKGAGLEQFYIDESGSRRQTANRLKKLALAMGVAGDIIDIEDPNYGTVKAYPVSVIERFKLEVSV
ncbi:BRO-N domain-containing protein [Aeromonas veronii]|uniref:BRO-N domain-containing protein n=1 Tax=Aeromonas veronii TaxID=654 RepID=UPI0019D5BC1A|nr:Bro-N domain-containing protein [Aeromonas veronii]